MKMIRIILTITLAFAPLLRAASISVEDFKKMDPLDREKTIQQAPSEEQAELRKLDLHMLLVQGAGGEAGLKAQKERTAIRMRGLYDLEGILGTQMQLWDCYASGVLMANKGFKMPPKQQADAERKFLYEGEALRARTSQIHALVFNIAASPSALELEKKVESLDHALTERFDLSGWNGKSPRKPVATKAQWDETFNEINQLIEEMKQLPKLTPEQAKKEYDAITDDKVRPWY